MGTARRVFLSHTSELRRNPAGRSFIDAAEAAVTRAEDVVVDMAYFGAKDAPPAAVCQERVRASDVYILIAGFRYGTLVSDRPELSYVELEFETATSAGKRCFAFLMNDQVVGGPDLLSDEHPEKQRAFRRRITAAGNLTVDHFANPDQLENRIYQALTTPLASTAAPAGPASPSITAEAFPVLAERAQQRLQSLLTALQRTRRVLEQVERSSTKPDGMDDWDSFADQDHRHAEIAAAVTAPAADLKVRAGEASAAAQDAREYTARLGSRYFSRRAARLSPVIRAVSELQELCGEVTGKMAREHDELTVRSEDYPDYYTIPCAALTAARDFLDDAADNVRWMSQALEQLHSPETGSSASQRPGLSVTSASYARAAETDAVLIPNLGKVAATPPGVTNAQLPDDPLWVPEKYGRRDGVYAVQVEGDSMSGSDIHNDDYVVVDPNQQPADGDIAVVRTDGPEDTRTYVKRVRIGPGEQLLALESTNPAYDPVFAESLEDPQVQGKVIGFFRPLA